MRPTPSTMEDWIKERKAEIQFLANQSATLEGDALTKMLVSARTLSGGIRVDRIHQAGRQRPWSISP